MPNDIRIADAGDTHQTSTNYPDTETKEWGVLSGYYSLDFLSNSTDLTALDHSDNIRLAMNDGTIDSEHKQAWSEFDRFYSIDLERELPSGRHYIFICRPDLYLLKDGSSNILELSSESRVNTDPYFTYLLQFHPEIIGSLTKNGFKGNVKKTTPPRTTNGSVNQTLKNLPMHAFMPYLTTRIEILQLPDYSIKQSSIVQPYTKYTVPYTTNAIQSTTGGSFSITFREDAYYSIHKLFYAWLYYQNNVSKNIFQPKNEYLMHNMLDYATSIYDFIVDETGENIIYWAKYTGCIPTEVPMSDLSFNRNGAGETKVSIDFTYFMCEHMDRNILMDFQYNSLGYDAMNGPFAEKKLNPFPMSETVPIYDSATFLGRNFVGRPVIFYGYDSNLGRNVFKLRWLP